MNRRTFLGTLAAALAGATLDPERLLWVPGRKTIFLPQWSPAKNVLVTPEWMATEVLRVLEQNLIFATRIHRIYDEDLRHARRNAHILAVLR